jgi:hypothetical protein
MTLSESKPTQEHYISIFDKIFEIWPPRPQEFSLLAPALARARKIFEIWPPPAPAGNVAGFPTLPVLTKNCTY